MEHVETFGLPERVFYCFPEAELGNLSSAAELGTSTDPSVNGGQQIKSWIRTCEIDHKHCPKRAGSANKFVPTRLLQIGGKRPGDPIRVVNTKVNKIEGPYMTLSHCWGDPKLLEECTLRSRTLEEFMFVGVPWSKLSINFKQAIEIARFMEIDYIWIDSLCIMQGDKDDWGDKQLAIWGVAKRVRDTLDEPYAAGMWEDALEEQLAWRVADCRQSERPAKLAAIPTWSWTSMQGTILVSDRLQAEDRCYRVTDHAGQPLSFKIKDDEMRPALPRHMSDNPEVMCKLLDLVDEKRRMRTKNQAFSAQAQDLDKTNITSKIYQNQYQFEIDVQHLLYKAHDAHLYFAGGITAAFSFQAPYSITAASLDGKSLPKVYLTSDIIKNRDEGGRPTAIKTINGEDAVDVWDSSVMFYPGDEIALVMEDDTEDLDYWLALWNEPYNTGPISTGGDVYNYFVLGSLPASYNRSEGIYNAAYAPIGPQTAPTPDNTWYNVTYKAYPDPDVRQERLGVRTEGIVSRYFLNDTNAAVLSIPSFGQYGYGIGNFSSAVSEFIDATLAANLSRVVIDLQQNQGGTIELAFSTFRRFFPEVNPFAGSRRRNHYLGDVLGEAYTAHFDTLPANDSEYTNLLADEWVITPRINAASGQNFTSWSEYRDSTEYNGDSLSLTERYNLSSYDYALALFDGWVPLDYTPEYSLDRSSQPFKTEDMVILTDGACSSACALLVEMFTQVGVKTVVAGGRPTTGPMQAVGGNRGAVIYSADQIDFRLLNNENYVDAATYASLPEITTTGFRDSGVYTATLAVNLRDQVRSNDSVSLQFKYEAADYRIFYTVSNVYNMSSLWRDTVTAAFDDESLCVEGSTGYSNSTKVVPKSDVKVQYDVDLDFGEPDAALITDDLDLSGGPHASLLGAKSNTVTPCDSVNSCVET
ncbi:hypothetical protein E8E11_009174 [Didymella keratinophila]|nr:hypothetical protein E8E11_009174 [Didymella keratinophila]